MAQDRKGLDTRIKKKKVQLGEILITKGFITQAVLDEAIAHGKRMRLRVGKALVDLGYISEQEVAFALASQYDLPCVSLDEMVIDTELINLIPESIVRKHKVIPISMRQGGELEVAMADPLDVFAIDELEKATGKTIMLTVAAESGILAAAERYYGTRGAIKEMADMIENSGVGVIQGEDASTEMLKRVSREGSIVKLVDMLFAEAINEGASDLHIEPDEDTLRVRMRVDGRLQETATISLKLHAAVISRIKILGDLDIAEKRLPQDGRFFLDTEGHDIDVRLSTMPTVHGEKAVMRLLDKQKMVLQFEALTPFPDTIEDLKKAARRPHGMILLTGPTGSGKTTTAYTLINLLNKMDRNIVTIEDPVEYHLKIVNQTQVNPGIGVTFASSLRHILRQDPDIIVIGEIRDKETAEIAVRAALTGHLLISTVHTNDASGAISRLIEMGIDPYLVASAVSCVLGQRLVRKICPDCKVPYEPEPAVVEELGMPPAARGKPYVFYRGEGCAECKGSGLKGRIPIYEVFIVDKNIRKMTIQKQDSSHILDALNRKGFKSLRTNGIRAVVEGYTTVEEILLATQLPE